MVPVLTNFVPLLSCQIFIRMLIKIRLSYIQYLSGIIIQISKEFIVLLLEVGKNVTFFRCRLLCPPSFKQSRLYVDSVQLPSITHIRVVELPCKGPL